MRKELVALLHSLSGIENQLNHLDQASEHNETFKALSATVDGVQRQLQEFSELFSKPNEWNAKNTLKSLSAFKEKLAKMIGAIKHILDGLNQNAKPNYGHISVINDILAALVQHQKEVDETTTIISETLKNKNHKWPVDLDKVAQEDFYSAWLIFKDPAKAVQISINAFPKIFAQFHAYGLDGVYGKALMQLMCDELEKRAVATLQQQNPECKQLARHINGDQALAADLLSRAQQHKVIPCSLEVNAESEISIKVKFAEAYEKDLNKFMGSLEREFPDLYKIYHFTINKWLVLANEKSACAFVQDNLKRVDQALSAIRTRLDCFHNYYAFLNPKNPIHLTANKQTNGHSSEAPALNTQDVPPALLNKHNELLAKRKELQHYHELVRTLEKNAASHSHSADAYAWRITEKFQGDVNNVDVNKELHAAYSRLHPGEYIVESIGHTLFGKSLIPALHILDAAQSATSTTSTTSTTSSTSSTSSTSTDWVFL